MRRGCAPGLLTSGVWNEKIENRFQQADLQIVDGSYHEANEKDRALMSRVFSNDTTLALFTGTLQVEDGMVLFGSGLVGLVGVARRKKA